MPSERTHRLADQYVRVALTTTAAENGGPYYSPYKFQMSNSDAKVPDQNPIFMPVNLPKEGDSMRYLLACRSELKALHAMFSFV